METINQLFLLNKCVLSYCHTTPVSHSVKTKNKLITSQKYMIVKKLQYQRLTEVLNDIVEKILNQIFLPYSGMEFNNTWPSFFCIT